MTVLSICNICLTALEDEPIQDLTDTKGGEWCDRSFDAALDSVLRLRPWSCNAKRTTLSANVDAPAFQFDYAYRVPDDLLDIRAVCDPYSWRALKDERVLEGRDILTNIEAPLYLRYGRKLTRNEIDNPLSDIYPLDPLFEECVAYKLGTLIAKAITGEQGDVEQMKERLRIALLDSGALDASQDVRWSVPDSDDWTDTDSAQVPLPRSNYRVWW